jgi:tetratricopeptide (TPR) repeat protein
MLPPPAMLATKNRAVNNFILILAVTALLAGCTPPGPRALLDGRRLLDEGQYAQAVEKFKTATLLMPTNAPAWNYLGLAYHRAGQTTNAVAAYTRALMLNRELLEVRYNLGCLRLDENNLDAAKSEFTAYTLRRSNAVEGWLKLGAVQLRSRDANGAEKSFREALRVNAQNVEALNGLGLVQLQRNHPGEAAQQFVAVLKLQPDYGPALLNLATVSQQHLHDRAGALQRYHEYLALKPQPEDWEAVSAVVKSLEQPLAVTPITPPRAPATNVAAPVATNKNPPKPPPVVPARSVTLARTEPAPAAPKPAAGTRTVVPTAPAQVVKLPPEPVIKTTPNDSPVKSPATNPQPAVTTPAPASATATEPAQPTRRGFLSRINPVNLFRSNPNSTSPKTADKGAPASGNSSSEVATTSAATSGDPTRYAYLNPSKPAEGNRREAARAFAQGQQAQRANKLTDAMNAYRQATQVDPAYYEAYYNLGLTAYAARSYRLALAAWESNGWQQPADDWAPAPAALCNAPGPVPDRSTVRRTGCPAPDARGLHWNSRRGFFLIQPPRPPDDLQP